MQASCRVLENSDLLLLTKSKQWTASADQRCAAGKCWQCAAEMLPHAAICSHNAGMRVWEL